MGIWADYPVVLNIYHQFFDFGIDLCPLIPYLEEWFSIGTYHTHRDLALKTYFVEQLFADISILVLFENQIPCDFETA